MYLFFHVVLTFLNAFLESGDELIDARVVKICHLFVYLPQHLLLGVIVVIKLVSRHMFHQLPKQVTVTWCEIGSVGRMAQNLPLKVL
jgi:hypothetical protein